MECNMQTKFISKLADSKKTTRLVYIVRLLTALAILLSSLGTFSIRTTHAAATASVGNLVWYDIDEDGIQDTSETGVSDVTVKLFDSTGNLVASDVTDSNGIYGFSGLDAGFYVVEFDYTSLPTGYVPTLRDAGTNSQDTVDSDGGFSGRTMPFELSAGEVENSLDLGIYVPNKKASIGNFVWYDNDHDGIQDAGELGVPNVSVQLLDSVGNVVATTATDVNGFYQFTDLEPGTYSIKFVLNSLPNGYVPSSPNSGSDDAKDSDANPSTGQTSPTELIATENDLTWDMGIYIPAKYDLALKKSLAANQTNFTPGSDVTFTLTVYNQGDLAVRNVTVTDYIPTGLTLNDTDWTAGANNTASTVIAGPIAANSSTTVDITLRIAANSTGKIVNAAEISSFTDNSGNPVSDDADSTPDNIKDNDGTPKDDVVDENSKTGGDEDDHDIAEITVVQLAAIGDYVWFDTDQDGVQDASETGVANVTVRLYKADGTLVGTTQTDNTGKYIFENLQPGDYYVQFDLSTLPAGSIVTSKDSGSDDAKDSDGNLTDGKTITTTLIAGERDLTWDLGIYQPVFDLALRKTVSGTATLTPGGDVTFTITVFNQGNQPVKNVVVTEYIPTGLTLNDTDWTAGANNTASITIAGPIAAGASTSVDVTMRVAATATGSLTNAAEVSSFTDTTGTPKTDKDSTPDIIKDNDGTPIDDAIDNPNDEDDHDISTITLTQLAAIGDYVWFDTDQDGVQDASETGVANVTVRLYKADGTLVGTTQTDNTGKYIFENLQPGDYYVQFDLSTLPAGSIVTSKDSGSDDAKDSDGNLTDGKTITTTLIAGERDLTWDLGIYQPVFDLALRKTVSGTATLTPGGDVTFTITVFNQGNQPVKNVVVTEYIPTGLTLNDTDWTAGANNTASITIAGPIAAGASTSVDVTMRVAATATGSLTNAAEVSSFTDTTGTPKTDKDSTPDIIKDNDGTPIDDAIDNPNDEDDHDISTITLTQLAAIGDYVWFDTDQDGVQDASETGVANVTVRLYKADGTLVGTTQTDNTGKYIFENLQPGDYYVQFDLSTLPAGSIVTSKDSGSDDAKDSDGNLTDGKTITTTLIAGERDLTWDLGIYQPVFDLALRKTLSTTTPVLPGGDVTFTITVFNQGNQPVKNVVVTEYIPTGLTLNDTDWTAGANNTASITLVNQLNAGQSVNVDVTLKVSATASGTLTNISEISSFTDTTGTPKTDKDSTPDAIKDNDGTPKDDVIDEDGQNGRDEDDNDIANVTIAPLASLGDYVWYDTNLDGKQDATEVGVPNVTVKLYKADGTLVGTTTTNANGFYQFIDLPAGDYYVQFSLDTLPAGYVITSKDSGSDDTKDSDANPTDGKTITTTLTAGENDLTWDAGIYQPAFDLALRKTLITTTNLLPGNDVTFALTVFNQGNQAVKNVVVTDYIPTGFTLNDTDWTAGANNTASITIAGPIAAGASVTVEITLKIGSGVSGQITNIGEISSFTDTTGTPKTDKDSTPDTIKDNDGTPIDDAIDNPNDEDDNDISVVTVGQLASLGDYVWYDTNLDGKQDATEVGVPNVTVKLYKADGTLVGTTTTNASGLYQFANLQPGDYYVQFDVTTLPAGFIPTSQDSGSDDAKDSDANPTDGKTITTTLTAGENDLTWDMGVYQPIFDLALRKTLATDQAVAVKPGDSITFSITVFNQGNQPVKNVKIVEYIPTGLTLDDTDWTAGENNTAYTISSALNPGQSLKVDISFKVATTATGKIVNTAEIASLTDINGTPKTDKDSTPDTTKDNDGTPIDDAIDNPNDEDDHDIAEITVSALASLGDYVWIDSNNNGIQDTNEVGVPNVVVKLYKADGTLVGTTTTDTNGKYNFINLPAGDYYVQFDLATLPAGFKPVAKDTGSDDAKDSDANPTDGKTATISLSAGENDITWDMGVIGLASLGDFVWQDTDGDGVQDAGEPGVPNVTVKLYKADGTLVGTTQTDSTGKYTFTNLVPGDYYVQFDVATLPAGFRPTGQDRGGDDAKDSDANPTDGKTATISLSAGENDITWDMGIARPASLGDYVWVDEDNDGIQDSNEKGQAGVVVKLFDSTGKLIATTTTDSTGKYLFDNLIPGSYYVEFVSPAEYGFGKQNQGTDDAKDSDIDRITGRSQTVTLVSGDNNTTVDAGLVKLASVGDYVWYDTDVDGVQDANEPPIKGVTVILLDKDGREVDRTTTDSTGKYLFDNLIPGDYVVQFVLPKDYAFTFIETGGDATKDSNANETTGLSKTITLNAGESNITIDAGMVASNVKDQAIAAKTPTATAVRTNTPLPTNTSPAQPTAQPTVVQPTAQPSVTPVPATPLPTISLATLVPNPTNPPAPTATPVAAGQGVLSIRKSVDRQLVNVGDTLTYTLQISNSGSATINDVVVVDPLSNKLDFLTVTSTQGSGSASGNTVTVNVGALGAGQTATITIAARVNNNAKSPDRIDNAAQARGAGVGAVTSNVASVQLVPTNIPVTGAWTTSGGVVMAIVLLLAAIALSYPRWAKLLPKRTNQ
jgi:uncharacterized repeat protein (TIGR01451 family)